MIKIVLASERTRRAFSTTMIILLAAVYFYEFPLYGLLYCYDLYQGLGGLDSGPSISFLDYALILVAVAMLIYIYLNPRDYVVSQDGGLAFKIVRKGKVKGTLSKKEITALGFKAYSKRRTQSRSSEFVAYHKIYCVADPSVVFYDSVSSSWWRTEKRVANKLERQLGRIDWHDKDGVLGGAPPRMPHESAPPPPEKNDLLQEKQRSKPPKVVKAYGSRLVMTAIFFAFSTAFWSGGYRVVAGVFAVVSTLLLIDLVLTLFGFGQQAD